ncbi:MAG TPA: HNH endonuclease [Oscillospiraceae bacterium]|nr:HNH endonuclease [Oscillospiraceae bacterium]
MVMVLNKKLLGYIKQGWYVKFYQSKEWRATRARVLQRDRYECQTCKDRGKVTVGTEDRPLEVHHIKHLKDYPLLGLAEDNLLTLCASCHNEEHPEKLIKAQPKPKFENEERWE